MPLSGLPRNLATLVRAWLAPGRVAAALPTECRFWVTPFDTGLRVLKSDRYLQLAEAAQLDFLVKTRVLGLLLRGRIGFVNASQLVKFGRPIGMFQRVRVVTVVSGADSRCAWFSHRFFVADQVHAEVWVKMKFKRGAITVPPADVLGDRIAPRPAWADTWDQVLAAEPHR